MNQELSSFAARLRGLIGNPPPALTGGQFSQLALELFALQFNANPAYRKICAARQLTPASVKNWTEIPCVPTGAFKELELSCLAPAERTAVFHSSGTTGQKPSRHFHSAESLAVYEASLWHWFQPHFQGQSRFIFLTPAPAEAPHSSLAHMFGTVAAKVGRNGGLAGRAGFFGRTGADGIWAADLDAVVRTLHAAVAEGKPLTILGAAFSFVHLLDHLAAMNRPLILPENSRVMETGGYKNRSRAIPKAELHDLITRRLGVPAGNIVCEYGMSELSSQAYDGGLGRPAAASPRHVFHFPPWARVRIVSPETGREAPDGGAGLIRVFDLANVFSVAAIQTEDLGVRRGDGFELTGRAQLAEARGCSLMTA